MVTELRHLLTAPYSPAKMPFRRYPWANHTRAIAWTANAGVGFLAGQSNVKSSWNVLFSNVAEQADAIALHVSGYFSATAHQNTLADIGYGDVGGGNEVTIVPNFSIGYSSAASAGRGRNYLFPVNIPAGKDLRMRAQTSAASDPAATPVLHAVLLKLRDEGRAVAEGDSWRLK